MVISEALALLKLVWQFCPSKLTREQTYDNLISRLCSYTLISTFSPWSSPVETWVLVNITA